MESIENGSVMCKNQRKGSEDENQMIKMREYKKAHHNTTKSYSSFKPKEDIDPLDFFIAEFIKEKRKCFDDLENIE